jgi:hypothetical protein
VTVLEACPAADQVLPFVEESVRALHESGLEPHTILAGPVAYGHLCEAVAERFGRAPGPVEQVQWIPVVVDPFRGAALCVVPAPREVAAGVRAERRDE